MKKIKTQNIFTVLFIIALFFFLFGVIILHTVINSSSDTFYFFSIPLSSIFVFDLGIFLAGIAFFALAGIVIYAIFQTGRNGLLLLAFALIIAFLVMLFFVFNLKT